ncbi:MAG TPA: NYN domain-containing protein [Candidatus Limnocylindria bacterium]|nr:NYN domain-containing protein [Candidatus Limnocylindria bacterium]
MGKNVAVFVDVANIFYAAKAAGVDIDYVTLLKASSAGRDLVRAYAYTGLDPDNDNQRNFHDFLRRHGYKVVSKDIRKYGDGKVKANLDIELVVDMMKTARNLDIAIVVSGDGDFAPAIRAVQEQGVRVEVVSFRGNTSSDLMDVADQFTDITQIAKVEKGSSRSGRRVSEDDLDLSMTEVPDKQSEGTGDRSRGRGRTRRTPIAATAATIPPSRGRSRIAAVAVAPEDAGEGSLVVLPGEKLSRAATARPAAAPIEAPFLDDEELDGVGSDLGSGEPLSTETGDEAAMDEARRRRRRRGGRGRGRGRAREDGTYAEGDEAPAAPIAAGPAGPVGAAGDQDLADEDEDVEAPAPVRRAASAFGSVWDSQIGIQASGRGTPVIDDEDLDEPAVPEYLLTERRQRDANRGGQRGGAGRGRGGAYAAALDRERFGGGRGSTPSRFAEPAPRREGGYGRPDRGPERGPERGGRMDRDRNDRGDRANFRPVPRPAPRTSGDEPWSEVPPEIEAMLRAQQSSRPAAPPPPPVGDDASAFAESAAPEVAPAPARRGRRTAAASTATEAPMSDAGEASTEAAPATRTRRTRATSTAATPDAMASEAAATEAPAAPKRTRTTSTATKSTTTRARAAKTEPAAVTDADADAAAAPAPKRRTSRAKAEPAA